jgi:hypothetical protein
LRKGRKPSLSQHRRTGIGDGLVRAGPQDDLAGECDAPADDELQRALYLVGTGGLGYVADHAMLNCSKDVTGILMDRYDDDGDGGMLLPKDAQRVEFPEAGHDEVEQEEVDAGVLLEHIESLLEPRRF